MDFWELVKKRRSVRKFDNTKNVTDEQFNKLLDAAIWAPSSGNTQCWRFFVVRNAKVKEELAMKAGHQPFMTDASAIIVVCADMNAVGRSYGSRGRETFALQDTAAAVQNILLAVTDLGLASCWVGAFDEGKAAKILGLEDHVRPVCMLPVGYAADDPNPPKRKPMPDVVKRIE